MMVDAYAIPQDDYFEWEDLNNRPFTSFGHNLSYLPDYKAPTDFYSCFKSLEQQNSPQPVLLPVYDYFNYDWSETRQNNMDSKTPSPAQECPAVAATPTPSEKKDTKPLHTPKQENSRPNNSPTSKVYDDLDLIAQPTQNVDYLACPWHRCESDLWASRKYLEIRRKKYGDHEDQTYDRLRNASWRAVAVGRLKLKKVDPQSFNWLKDQDLTWLHGPYVPQSPRPNPASSNQPPSQLPKPIVKAVRQEKRPSKSALKQPSLKTLLLRGSSLCRISCRLELNKVPQSRVMFA